MRRPLGTSLVPPAAARLASSLAVIALSAALLTGCGDDSEGSEGSSSSSDGPVATDPSPTPTPTQTPTPTPSDGDAAEPVEYDVALLRSASAAGGSVSPMLSPVTDAAEIDTFVSQFELDEFADQLRTDATTLSYQGQLWAGVVSVGCDVPPGVVVEEGEAGYLVTAQKVVDPLPNCLVPVTTVAFVAIR